MSSKTLDFGSTQLRINDVRNFRPRDWLSCHARCSCEMKKSWVRDKSVWWIDDILEIIWSTWVGESWVHDRSQYELLWEFTLMRLKFDQSDSEFIYGEYFPLFLLRFMILRILIHSKFICWYLLAIYSRIHHICIINNERTRKQFQSTNY